MSKIWVFVFEWLCKLQIGFFLFLFWFLLEWWFLRFWVAVQSKMAVLFLKVSFSFWNKYNWLLKPNPCRNLSWLSDDDDDDDDESFERCRRSNIPLLDCRAEEIILHSLLNETETHNEKSADPWDYILYSVAKMFWSMRGPPAGLTQNLGQRWSWSVYWKSMSGHEIPGGTVCGHPVVLSWKKNI